MDVEKAVRREKAEKRRGRPSMEPRHLPLERNISDQSSVWGCNRRKGKSLE